MKMQLVVSCVLLVLALTCSNVAAISCWVCDNVYSEEECQEKGYLKSCPDSETMCHIELRHGGWGNSPMIQKSCKRPSACVDNFVQNIHDAWSKQGNHIQCNRKPPSSVCRCCCATEQCNANVLECNLRRPNFSCSALQSPEDGSMGCSQGFLHGSTCTFSCKRGFGLEGVSALYCDRNGKWSAPPPMCKPITCPPGMRTPKFGSKSCTDGINLRSICSFSCQQGYRLKGARRMQCIDDLDGDAHGLWSRRQPECVPLQCPELTVSHGSYSCSNRNLVGSRCTLQCNSKRGYRVHPSSFTSANCQPNEKWTSTACCGLSCPPFAIMDFVLILDSSSSVGRSNWEKMTTFAKGFLDDFIVRNDSSRFGIIRYNAHVDVKTRILLNDYTDSTEAVLQAFERIPYDGSGTRTGNALTYAADVLLRIGNRPAAKDIVLLITDGVSQDDVSAPAKRIRDTGAQLYVLPVLPPVGRLDLDEIRSMVTSEAFILKDALERGFDALDEQFSAKISKILCGNPCENPFHDHSSG